MKNRYLEKIAGFQRSLRNIMARKAQLETAERHRLLKWFSGQKGKKPTTLTQGKKNVRTS